MKIADEEIARLKREVSLVQLVESFGVKLSGNGDNLMGLCPLHNDREPSLVVSPAKGLWHCLGACQTGGDVIAWVMKTRRVSFRLAVAMLREPSTLAAGVALATPSKLEALVETTDEPDAVVMQRTLNFYHATLKQTPEGLAYFQSRGLENGEMIEHFRLGFANRTLGYRLPKMQVRSGELIRKQMQRLGIMRSSGHEHFGGCVIVPTLGEDGSVKELYGRKISVRSENSGNLKHLYLPSHEDRGVFNLAAFRASKDLAICESLIDALTFWCAGHRNVTSAYGVEGFTAQMRQALVDHGTRRILIAYDRDDAGDKAAEKLAGELAHAGLEVFRVVFPRGMDANEYAQKMKPADKALELVLRSAQWMAGTRPVSVPAAIEAEMVATIESEIASAPALEAPHDPITGELLEPVATAESVEAKSAGAVAPAAIAPAAVASSSAPASAVAKSAPAWAGLLIEERKHEVRVLIGDRTWRVRGLAKNTSYESLRLNVMVTRGDAFFVDVFEVYLSRQRTAFVKQAAEVLKVDDRILDGDLGKLVLWLEDRIHQEIEKVLEPSKKIEMSEEERAAALELLRDPKLCDRILADFEKAGVVGEESNKLMGYLAAVTRKLDRPLAVVIQSSSAAGKSSLMDAVLRFMPEEERVQFSAMTGQSLFYMGEEDLAHKILAIAEEEGAQSASYALKLLQSEGELTIASTGKDPTTGRLITHPYSVKGPVMIFMTTTAIDVDEELLNRCLVLSVDEGSKQTSAIHERQREAQTLEGLFQQQDREAVVQVHQNVQRLLETLFVVNPYAKTLKFSHHATRTRRDHMKYLTLMQAIALLHQHQRPILEVERNGKQIRYVEVTPKDIELADRLAASFIMSSLEELPPQTRRLLELIEEMVVAESKRLGIEREKVRFSRKDVREYTKWGDSALKKHVSRLEGLEHLLVHGGGSRRRLVYELAFASPSNWSPPEGSWSGPGHAEVTPGGGPDPSEKSRTKVELVTDAPKSRLGTVEKSTGNVEVGDAHVDDVKNASPSSWSPPEVNWSGPGHAEVTPGEGPDLHEESRGKVELATEAPKSRTGRGKKSKGDGDETAPSKPVKG